MSHKKYDPKKRLREMAQTVDHMMNPWALAGEKPNLPGSQFFFPSLTAPTRGRRKPSAEHWDPESGQL